MTDWGKLAAARLAEIAKISEPGPGVTRLPFTPEHRQAIDLLTVWMHEAGLSVHLDAAGTLIGRQEGPAGAPTFLMGSHQDSVRGGGAFDGIMGVVLPIIVLTRLREEPIELPVSVEILAFADEEGVRFPTALMGPRALAGTFNPADRDLVDENGISLRSAMEAFGLPPGDVPALRRSAKDVLGYLETHIEQGPVLEQAGEALGVVTAICGIERHQLTLTGETGHAGTLPMQTRRDALVGAASVISEVNRLARSVPDLRGTVGAIHVWPNVVNAVPKQVRMTVELRAPEDVVREKAGADLREYVRTVAQESGLEFEMTRSYQQPAQPCDTEMSDRLAAAIQATGGQGMRLPSGATHDASAMADLCPVSMLFIRCRNGLSHVPEEYASPEDLGKALEALHGFLKSLHTP